MPRSSETLLRLTTRHRVMAELGISSFGSDARGLADAQTLERVIDAFSREAAALMGGHLYKEERVEVHDVKRGQRTWFVDAWPIDTTTAPALVYNTSNPRDFSDAANAVDADYVICDAWRAEAGIVELDTVLSPARSALQITYTGGLATFTGADGIDGAVTAGSLANFTSATSRFQSDGVVAGHILVIETGANAGSWRISAVNSQTSLTCDRVAGEAEADPAFAFTAGTSIPFHILDSNSESLVTDWPEIADAMTNAIDGWWRRRGGHSQFTTESAGGMSVGYVGPYNLPNRSRDEFISMRKKWRF